MGSSIVLGIKINAVPTHWYLYFYNLKIELVQWKYKDPLHFHIPYVSPIYGDVNFVLEYG